HVKRVRHDAGFDEALTMLVEIDAPGITGAIGKHFEGVLCRMIAPHAGVDGCAVLVRSARFSDARVSEYAVTAIEPTIGTPAKSVERLMRIFVMPAIEQNLRLARWFVLAFFHRHEHQVGRSSDPDAAKADFQPADKIQSFHEDSPLVKFANALGVLKDHNAI